MVQLKLVLDQRKYFCALKLFHYKTGMIVGYNGTFRQGYGVGVARNRRVLG